MKRIKYTYWDAMTKTDGSNLYRWSINSAICQYFRVRDKSWVDSCENRIVNYTNTAEWNKITRNQARKQFPKAFKL